jgi:DNA-binding transcriptional ArsR family regulator
VLPEWFVYHGTMDDTPGVATIAGLIGDRTRATILMGLMAGRSVTASELARSASVTKQTASAHLSKLVEARLVAVTNAGRHRYFRIADHHVAGVIESLVGLAHRLGAAPIETGPSDPAMRKARVCYDHLAGDLGVLVFDSLSQQGFLRVGAATPVLTERGEQFCGDMGVDMAAIEEGRRPVCLACLDWSVRRHHLAGALGAAILSRIYTLGWARRPRGSRVVLFSAAGEQSLRARFRYRPA